MRNKSVFSLALFLILAAALTFFDFPAFSQQETVTITTYYPAPFGVYQQLVTRTLGVGDNNNDGAIGGGDAPDPAIPAQDGDLWVSGNVGIGTTGPQMKLHVVSDTVSHIAGRFDVSNTEGIGMGSSLELHNTNATADNVTGIMGYNAIGAAVAGMEFVNVNHGSATRQGALSLFTMNGGVASRLYMTKEGNVGIGTTIPVAQLHIASREEARNLFVSNTGTDVNRPAEIYFQRNFAGDKGDVSKSAAVGIDNTRDFFIWVNGFDRLNIDTAGNVGIGETSPQSPAPNSQSGNLDVNDVYLRSTGEWMSQKKSITGTIQKFVCEGSGTFIGCRNDWGTASCNASGTVSCSSGDQEKLLMTAFDYVPESQVAGAWTVCNQGWCHVELWGCVSD